MDMSPEPTSAEMLRLAEDMPSHSSDAKRRYAFETGARYLGALPRISGLGKDMRIRLENTPGGDLKISFTVFGRHVSYEISKRPSWQNVRTMYQKLGSDLQQQIVFAKAIEHKKTTGIDPAWSYHGNVMISGMIDSTEMTMQEYHEIISKRPDCRTYSAVYRHGDVPDNPGSFVIPTETKMIDDDRLPRHQIRPQYVGRRYSIDYYCLSDDVWWSGNLPGMKAGFVLRNQVLPETLRQSVIGMPVGKVISHPSLTDDRMIISGVRMKGKTTLLQSEIVVDWLDDVPTDIRTILDGLKTGFRLLDDLHRPYWDRPGEKRS